MKVRVKAGAEVQRQGQWGRLKNEMVGRVVEERFSVYTVVLPGIGTVKVDYPYVEVLEEAGIGEKAEG